MDGSRDIAQTVLNSARSHGLTVVTAESCTGGSVASALTAVPGSSEVFDRGFVTYSNRAKAEMLGVDPALIVSHGAVSEEVALAMARGALRKSTASLSVAVTGVAGPGGGSAAKPVGLVYFALARRVLESDSEAEFALLSHEERFGDIGRAAVREKSVEAALRLLLYMLNMA